MDVGDARRGLARPHRVGRKAQGEAAADRGRGGGRRAHAGARGRRAARRAGHGMTRVLITGFSPFPGAPVNPTAALATRLARAGRRRGLDCIAHVFATTYAAVDRELPMLIAAHRPDAILMLGLAARRAHVSIEVFARNRASTWFPDAGGVVAPRRAIAAGASAATRGRAEFSRLLAAARAARVKTLLSRDAGNYVCNYVYWRALEAAAGPGGPRRAVFVHVPRVTANARRRDGAKRPRFAFAQFLRVGEAILAALARR